MIRIRQTFGAHTGRVLEFASGLVRFGRLPDNEVSFDPHADLDCSGRHAEIREEGGEFFLVDVGSRNGTLVAGRPVSRHRLQSGDVVEFGLGGPRVVVEFVAAVAREVHPLAETSDAAAVDLYAIKSSLETGLASGSGEEQPMGWADGSAHPTPPPSPFLDPAPQFSPPNVAQGLSEPLPPAPQPPNLEPEEVRPPAGRLYGQQTVGVMIQAAVEQANARPQSALRPGPSTGQVRQVAQETAQRVARRSSRWLWALLAVLTLALVGVAAALVGLYLHTRQEEQLLRDENVGLQGQLAELGAGEEAERQRLEERIGVLNAELSAGQQSAAATIAAANARSIYAIFRERGRRQEVICTAFAVRPYLLASSAQCVGTVERELSRGARVSAIPNHGQGDVLQVRRMWRHPHYQATPAAPGPDVGLIRVSAITSAQARLGDTSAATGLRTGDDIFVFGFAQQAASSPRPVAGLTTGVVGRVTGFDGGEAPPSERHLVSHSAFTDSATAGSPIFNEQGVVIAVNGGRYRANQRVVDPGTGMARSLTTDTAFSWAVRVDVLSQLLAGLEHAAP